MLTYFFSFFLQPITGAFDSYFQIILRNSGYSQSMVGLIIGVGSLSTIILPFFAAYLTGRGKSEKKIMFVSAVIAAFAMIPAILGAPVGITLVTVFLAMGTRWCVASISDGYINKQISGNNSKYGTIRGCGTLGYVVFMLFWAFSGFPANNDNLQILINIFSVVALFCLVLVLNPENKSSVVKNGKFFNFNWFDANFYTFMAIIAVSRISMAAVDKLLASYMTEVLGYGQYFTALIALGALSEFFMLVFGGKFTAKHNTKPTSLLIISCLGIFVRMLIYANTSGLGMFIAAQLLHSCAFGACHLAANNYITKHVREEHLSMAFAIYWALAQNLPQMLGSFAGGFIIDNLGYRSLFTIYSVFPVIAFILCIFNNKRLNK